MTKRPLFFICLSFVCGMYILSAFSSQSVLNFCLIAGLALVVMLVRNFSAKRVILIFSTLISFCSGCLYYDHTDNIETKALYKYRDTAVSIVAEVLETPVISENSISFVAEVSSVNDNNKPVLIEEKIKLCHYITDDNKNNDIFTPVLGDIIVSDVEIKIPDGPKNTGGFDYARYLKSDNIFFQGEIDLTDYAVKEHKIRPIAHVIEKFRQKCIGFINDAFPDDKASVLRAFIIGDRSGISDEVNASFSKSGLSHVLAVSGLHVSTFVTLIASLLKFLKVSKRKEMFISSAGAVLFVIFTGAPVSAIRAGMLAVFALVAKLLYRKSDSLTVLSIAASVLCICNPHVIYSASFMLSFGAVLGIVLCYDGLKNYFSKLYNKLNKKSITYRILKDFFESLAVGISAQIFVLPMLIYMFNSFSIMSVFATMAVSVFLSPLLAGGLLFIAISFVSSKIAGVIGFLVLWLTRAMLAVAEAFSALPFSEVLYGELSLFTLLLYALVIFTTGFMIKKMKKQYIISLSSLCILAILGIINHSIHFDLASVSFLNVGQGDCALVKTPGDCDILIDVGGYSHSEATGEYTIAPYLLKNGVTDVEYIIISHIDSDHTIGLSGLLKRLKVEKLILPYGQQYSENFHTISQLAKKHEVEIGYFSHGDVLKINDEIRITCILPDKEQFKYSTTLNDTGTVLRLDYGESSFLFSGDISTDVEKHLLRNYSQINDTDVLKVAHHGSKNSSCLEFINAVNPDYAFISVGKNSYGHPDSQVIDNIRACGAQVYRADMHKDVTFYFDRTGIKGVKYNKKIAEE